VLKLLGDGYTADITREYPELEKEDVYQAAKLRCVARQRTSRRHVAVSAVHEAPRRRAGDLDARRG
jgi:uncharacterized protein (DUF433 family)